MAHAKRSTLWNDTHQPDAREEWESLRDELEGLLDQVTDRQQRAMRERPNPEIAMPAAGIEGDDRRREALKSVQRAVQRFNEHEEAPEMPAQSPERLQSAIEQIRASQNRALNSLRGQPAPESGPVEPATTNHFSDLKDAIGDIGQRMARFETALQSQDHSGRAVEEIAQQMEQLTSVVEILANSVGEQGHIKRIESQIARLAEIVSTGPELDIDTVSQRLEVLSGAFERLSQLQADQQFPEVSDYSENFAALEGGVRHVSDALHNLDLGAVESGVLGVSERLESMDFSAIEACVRSVYDRIDTLESNISVSTPAIERLTRDLAEFTEVMRNGKGPVVTSSLVTRVDALNARLSEIEDGGQPVDALKFDVEELRGAVVSAVEPRFSAIESQIGDLADRFAAPSPLDATASISGLETQVRRLADRLDQTGQDLIQLQSLYAEGAQKPAMPDLGALADLVAERTSSAVSQAQNQTPTGVDVEALTALEGRLSKMFADRPDPEPVVQDFSTLERSIHSVHARLKGLEETLSRSARTVEQVPAATAPTQPTSDPAPLAVDEAPVPAESQAPKLASEEIDEFSHTATRRFQHPGLDDEPAAAPKSASHLIDSLRDTMPRSPSEETALNAPAYPDPEPESDPILDEFGTTDLGSARVPVPDALAAEPEDYAMIGRSDAEDEFGLEAGDGSEPRANRPVEVPRFDNADPAPPPPPLSDFARGNGPSFANDTQRQATDSPAEIELGSDQNVSSGRSTFIAAARRAAQQNNPEESEAGAQSLFGRALSRFQRKREADASGAAGAPAEPGNVSPARLEPAQLDPAPDLAPSPVGSDDGGDAVTGFLARHRRALLLGAAVLAVSLLTLNLISQKMGGDTPANGVVQANTIGQQPDAGTPIDAPVAAEQDTRPVNGAEAATPATDFPVGSIEQPTSQAVPEVRIIDPTPLAEMPTPLALASFTPDQAMDMTTAPGMPPEALGPIGLRQAAADGDARAQFEVAAIFSEGRAVPQDLTASAIWYERSAAQGFAPAAYRLGNMYENGTGVALDLEKARFWYEKAAGLGNRMSMHNLASIMASGALGEQAFGEAAVWFERAAGLGLTDSQFNLGMLYARGLGVPQSLTDSYKWFSIAAAAGDEDAAQARDDISRSLDADAVSRLQGEIGQWMPQRLDIQANFAPIGTWSDAFDPGPRIESREVIQRVQAALNKLGFDTGTPDGLTGPKTTDAIKAFEDAAGMSAIGEVNPRLLAVLGSQPV